MNKLSVLWKFVSMKKDLQVYQFKISWFALFFQSTNKESNVARFAAMRQQSKAHTNQRGNTSTRKKINK